METINYVDPSVVEKAVKRSSTVAAYISVLAKHGVCGLEKNDTLNQLANFLTENNVDFEKSEAKKMIWSPKLPVNLLTLFRKPVRV